MLKERLKSITYKRKIFLELAVMSLLPILLLTVFSIFIIRKDMQERMDLMSAQRVERVQERTDRILWSIWESYFEIFMTDSVNAVITQDLSYQDYSIYSDAAEKLEGQTYLRDYIRGFSFINLDTKWVLSSRGMYPLAEANNYSEVIGILKDKEYYAGKLVNSTKEIVKDLPHSTIDTNGVYMLFCLPMNAKTPQCAVIVNLNMDAFQEFIDDGDEYEITVTDKENRILLATDAVAAEYVAGHPNDVKAREWITLEEGRRVRLSSISRESDYFNYIITYDSSMIGRESQRIISFSLVLIGVILATGFAVLVTGRRVYQPIAGLREKISGGMHGDKNEKGDDIRFIEKNISDMMSTIRNQKHEMVRFLLSRLLSGTIRKEEIEKYWNELDLPTYSDYCIMALTPSSSPGWDQDMERNILLSAIEEGALKSKKKDIIVSRVWNKSLILLIGGDTQQETEEKVMQNEETIRRYLKENGIHDIQFGASQMFHELEYAMRAYHEAVEAAKISEMEYAKSGNQEMILYADIADHGMERASYYPVAGETRVKELVDACMEKEACMEAGRLIDELYGQRMSTVERRYYLFRLLLAILEVSNDAGLPVSEIKVPEDKDILFLFSEMYGSEDMKRFINRQVIPGVIASLREFRSTHTVDIKEKVMRMIRKAKGDITLAECAEKLHYSTSYLGRILRCENNDSFSTYVAEQKLAYAKSLLEETERSVADIAKELNYANTQNFIRFFNKWVGMTPGKYRESRKKRTSDPVD